MRNLPIAGSDCRAHEVARLELFGTVLRDDFRPDRDMDLPCTLKPGGDCTLLGWADLGFKLEAIFGRRVDLGRVARRAPPFTPEHCANFFRHAQQATS